MENITSQTPTPPSSAQNSSDKRVSALLIVFLLLFFWPLALYFMYKDKKYHSWIAILLIFIGLLMAVANWFFAFLLIPQITSLYKSLDIEYSTTIPYLISVFMLAANFAAAVLGVVLFQKLRMKNDNSKKLVTVSTIALVLSMTLSILGPIAASAPIYNLINRLYGNEYIQRACTMEAKICPDGSSVGRSGPNCEFSPCPIEKTATYTDPDYGFSFRYAKDLTIQIGTPSGNILRSLAVEKDVQSTNGGGFMGGDVLKKGMILYIIVWKNKEISSESLKSEFGSDVSISESEIGGMPATGVVFPDSPYQSKFFVSLPSSETLEIGLQLGFENTQEENAKYSIEQFSEIIPTFKFTNQNEQVELGDFPIYPGAKFTGKGKDESGKEALSSCFVSSGKKDNCVSYNFTVTGPNAFRNIHEWYKPGIQSGWECKGGAGAVADNLNEGDTSTFCNRGNLSYGLALTGNSQQARFYISIPQK